MTCSSAQKKCHLRLSGVSFTAPNGSVLVDDAGFELAQGSIAALVGPNGAGKTTLIRMIAGLAVPQAGTITLSGLSLPAMSFAERAKHIAYVGQTDEPDGRLTVRQYIALGGLSVTSINATENPDRIIDQVGLVSFANTRLDHLSGGERQKAKIARALCQKPSLLILDEPTNHLDPRARGELLGLVAQAGITVIVSLHDLTLIDTFADQVVVMEGGRVNAFGAPLDVLSNDRVRAIFGVGLHRFARPDRHVMETPLIPALDITIARGAA